MAESPGQPQTRRPKTKLVPLPAACLDCGAALMQIADILLAESPRCSREDLAEMLQTLARRCADRIS